MNQLDNIRLREQSQEIKKSIVRDELLKLEIEYEASCFEIKRQLNALRDIYSDLKRVQNERMNQIIRNLKEGK